MNRDEAYALMLGHTPSESLQRHMLNVETAMRWYARHWGEDEETYAVTGLLHDFDYELHPEEHPTWGVTYLREHTDVSYGFKLSPGHVRAQFCAERMEKIRF